MSNELIITSREELQAMIIDAVNTGLEKRQENSSGESPTVVMDIDAFCAYTGLSKQTVYRKTRSGEVPHSKCGKRLYFDKNEVDEWLLSNKISTKTISDKAESYFQKKRVKR